MKFGRKIFHKSVMKGCFLYRQSPEPGVNARISARQSESILGEARCIDFGFSDERARKGPPRQASGFEPEAGYLEKFGEGFARLQRQKLDGDAFEEVTHDAAAHVAELNRGANRRADVDIDGGARK